MDKQSLSKEEIDRLLGTNNVQAYRAPTAKEYKQILESLNDTLSKNMEVQNTENIEQLNQLISHKGKIDTSLKNKREYEKMKAQSSKIIKQLETIISNLKEMDIRVEELGGVKHININHNDGKEYFDTLFLTINDDE